MDEGVEMVSMVDEDRVCEDNVDGDRVCEDNAEKESSVALDDGATLKEGDCIIVGRYRITKLLYQRPRLNLYLGRRIAAGYAQDNTPEHEVYEPLVAIRELVLCDLPAQLHAQIEVAAFEEYVSPIVLGSPRLPTEGDRVWVEGERHYLIMQLQDRKNDSEVGTLADLLINHTQWPAWLSHGVALQWGTQLCRIVARLHRLGVVLVDLSPTTILADEQGCASWAPILLTSWPPAPQFWPPDFMNLPAPDLYTYVFPIAAGAEDNVFVAPEVLEGTCDGRSDVYSLGAILYLLLTGYAPVSAARRLRAIAEQSWYSWEDEDEVASEDADLAASEDALELVAPHLLCDHLSGTLEEVILTALELDPERRYASAFELVEALEALDVP